MMLDRTTFPSENNMSLDVIYVSRSCHAALLMLVVDLSNGGSSCRPTKYFSHSPNLKF